MFLLCISVQTEDVSGHQLRGVSESSGRAGSKEVQRSKQRGGTAVYPQAGGRPRAYQRWCDGETRCSCVVLKLEIPQQRRSTVKEEIVILCNVYVAKCIIFLFVHMCKNKSNESAKEKT